MFVAVFAAMPEMFSAIRADSVSAILPSTSSSSCLVTYWLVPVPLSGLSLMLNARSVGNPPPSVVFR